MKKGFITYALFTSSEAIKMEINQNPIKNALIKTIPVFCGYLFLGIAFGLLLEDAGYNVIWAFFSSVFIYAGSLQFLLVTFLVSKYSLLTVFIMSFLINCRHIFYGISFVDDFKKMGKACFYMIFSLTDETYSLLCTYKQDGKTPNYKEMLWVALFDHSYWVLGSVLGVLIGSVLPFDITGVDFTMTALFVVIFLSQWESYKSHLPAIVGLGSALCYLVILGPDNFILPSLLTTSFILILLKDYMAKKEGVHE